MSALTLALPFDTDNAEFRRGVEAGMLWAMTGEREPGITTATVHADCAEMVIRIAEARSLPFAAGPAGDDWLHVTIGIAPMTPLRPGAPRRSRGRG